MNATINSSSYPRQATSSGFTLIELMVTIAIMGTVIGFAAPNISAQLANQRVKSTTATLTNALKEAKIESVIRRQPITVTFINNSSSGGTISIANTANITSYDYDAKSKIGATNTTSGVVATTITFRPSKQVDAGLTYTICDSDISALPRQVTISAVALISNKLGGTCP